MGQVSLHGKHLLGLQHATPEEIKLILDVAKKMKKDPRTSPEYRPPYRQRHLGRG